MSIEEFKNLKIGDVVKDGWKSIVYEIDKENGLVFTKTEDKNIFRRSFGHFKFVPSPIKKHNIF